MRFGNGLGGGHTEARGFRAPHPERVSDEYADERIREKIARYAEERQRAGLWNVARDLKDQGVPAAYRLHFITAVANLGQRAAENLDLRIERAQEEF